ncbi:MAG: thermonuclease family protein [Planctomycetes bacterium]|nr:thermonuclease family protein [Planctomycetota bacterium]
MGYRMDQTHWRHGALLALATAFLCGLAWGEAVKSVVDGDTVELATGDRVRLIGIDSPERGELFYDAAKIYLKDLVLGKAVRIERDADTMDSYGRKLGYLFVGRTFVNGAMVYAGLAYASSHPPNTRYEALLFAAQRDARAARRGLWREQKVSDERFYVGNLSTHKFHRPSCEWAAKIEPKHQVRLTNRVQGLNLDLTPCRSCKP